MDQQPRTTVCQASSLFEELGNQLRQMNEDVDVRVTEEMDDDNAKVSRTLIGIIVENCGRDFILNPKMNWKLVKTG